jgi:hypothetical protein
MGHITTKAKVIVFSNKADLIGGLLPSEWVKNEG